MVIVLAIVAACEAEHDWTVLCLQESTDIAGHVPKGSFDADHGHIYKRGKGDSQQAEVTAI